MITDTLLDNWKKWLEYSLSRNPSPASNLAIQLRDSEELKTYPGIYLEESMIDRMESSGVADSNAFKAQIKTMLVTTPADEDQAGSTKAEHDAMRVGLSKQVASELAFDWMNAQIGIVVFECLTGSPVTTNEDGYRVTTWTTEMVACVDS